jgi:YD repeat-containing protein
VCSSDLLRSVAAPTGPGNTARTVAVSYLLNGTDDAQRRPQRLSGPDAFSVAFQYTGDRLTQRTNRRGHAWTYTYDAGLVRTATLSDTSLTGGAIVHTLCAAEALSLSTCGGAAPPLTTAASTLLDGPRPDVGDTTRVWLTRQGAPAVIRNALGQPTTLDRTDARFPTLVTALVDPAGVRTEARYTARGLLDSLILRNPRGDGIDAVTTSTWHATWEVPTATTSPEGEVTTYGVDAATGWRLWAQDARGDSTRALFTYTARGQLATVQLPGNTGRDSLLYDAALGNLLRTRTAGGAEVQYVRDALGRDSVVRTPISGTTVATQTFVYDPMDRASRPRRRRPSSAMRSRARDSRRTPPAASSSRAGRPPPTTPRATPPAPSSSPSAAPAMPAPPAPSPTTPPAASGRTRPAKGAPPPATTPPATPPRSSTAATPSPSSTTPSTG